MPMTLARLDSLIRLSSRSVAAAGLLLLFLNALAVVVDVALRAMLSAPIALLPDISSVVFYLAAAAALPAATAMRRHVTIRALEGVLPPRGEALLDALAALVTTAVFAVIAWQIALYTLELTATHRTLFQLSIPVAPFWWAVTALLAFNALIEALAALRHLCVALGAMPAEAA